MSFLILPRKVIVQPQEPLRLNLDSHLGAKCIFAWHPGIRNLFIVTKKGYVNGIATGTAPTINPFVMYKGEILGRFHPNGAINGLAGINTKASSSADVTLYASGYPKTTNTANLSALNRGINSDSLRLKINGECSYIDSSPAQISCNVYNPVEVDRYEQVAFTKNGTNLKSYGARSGNTTTVTGGNGALRSDGVGDFFYINHDYRVPKGHVDYKMLAAFEMLTDAEVEHLFENSWQIFEPKKRIVYFDLGGDGSTLTGANGTQVNEASTGAIATTYALSGENLAQSNAASTGSISVDYSLLGNNATQSNQASTGSLLTVYSLTGSNATQENTESTGAVSVSGAIELTGNNCTQSNSASTGAVSTTYELTGSNASQSNEASTGGITFESLLTGNNLIQVNSALTGSISTVYLLTGNNLFQNNAISSGSVYLVEPQNDIMFFGVGITRQLSFDAGIKSSVGISAKIHKSLDFYVGF